MNGFYDFYDFYGRKEAYGLFFVYWSTSTYFSGKITKESHKYQGSNPAWCIFWHFSQCLLTNDRGVYHHHFLLKLLSHTQGNDISKPRNKIRPKLRTNVATVRLRTVRQKELIKRYPTIVQILVGASLCKSKAFCWHSMYGSVCTIRNTQDLHT